MGTMAAAVKNSQVEIQPADYAAGTEIRAMIRAGRLNPFGLDWRRFLLAVTSSGDIVGCVQTRPHRGGARELASLYVRPEWRRRGVGARLVQAILERESPPLWLTCRSELVPFYRRFGFEPVERMDEMPTYFRLVWWMFGLVRRLTRTNRELVVMSWR